MGRSKYDINVLNFANCVAFICNISSFEIYNFLFNFLQILLWHALAKKKNN